jgi:hypothetical protein
MGVVIPSRRLSFRAKRGILGFPTEGSLSGRQGFLTAFGMTGAWNDPGTFSRVRRYDWTCWRVGAFDRATFRPRTRCNEFVSPKWAMKVSYR